MMRSIRLVFVILVSLTMGYCSDLKVVSEQELKDYVMDPDHGLLQKAQKNGVDIEVIYRPSELVLAQQLDGVTDKDERRKTIRNFDSLRYFVLKLSRKGQEIENAYVSDNSQFSDVISYLSAGIGHNIYLVHKSDTIRALDAVYARMFGAANATSVMAVFDTDFNGLNGEIRFCLDDTGLDLGLNEFEFNLADIKKTPTLNLN